MVSGLSDGELLTNHQLTHEATPNFFASERLGKRGEASGRRGTSRADGAIIGSASANSNLD